MNQFVVHQHCGDSSPIRAEYVSMFNTYTESVYMNMVLEEETKTEEDREETIERQK